jgi:hypothetical protein
MNDAGQRRVHAVAIDAVQRADRDRDAVRGAGPTGTGACRSTSDQVKSRAADSIG